MAKDVIIKFRSYLPGGGHDRAGGQRQGKTNVRGRIEVTSSVTEGEKLRPHEVGLTKIDDIHLTLEEPLQGASVLLNHREVGYSHQAQEFYVWSVAGTSGIVSIITAASTLNLTFDAFGDSAHDVELL